jgi:hypothetical protein
MSAIGRFLPIEAVSERLLWVIGPLFKIRLIAVTVVPAI